MDVTKAQGVLSSDGTGKIDQLKNELQNTQKSMLLIMQNDLHTFAYQVDVELDLLKHYKEDLGLIKNSITKLSTNVDTTNQQSQKDTLRQLKNVISYLEEQVYKF